MPAGNKAHGLLLCGVKLVWFQFKAGAYLSDAVPSVEFSGLAIAGLSRVPCRAFRV